MPTAFTKGITTGTVRIIAATECKKKPITKRTTLNMDKPPNLLYENLIIELTIYSVTCSIVKNYPNNTYAATHIFTYHA